ncbi:hypothetical protein SPI_01591 [Niveomyces insectorum RCEF 264]|uniref:Uncharacterized protein n=1 Tax=Niveomyces insectorum RCEF 264 TaxID=1081102 RepID=A0A167Z2X3_9HYPO|nr:hypothetical protein SPI_01591 [Niveomyces insectorum RCEF 264]
MITSGRVRVGRLVTGEWITDASSTDMPTAFSCVPAQQATADLSAKDGSGKIQDGMVDICVRYPDHHITAGTSDHMQRKMALIPVQPYGMGLAEARP